MSVSWRRRQNFGSTRANAWIGLDQKGPVSQSHSQFLLLAPTLMRSNVWRRIGVSGAEGTTPLNVARRQPSRVAAHTWQETHRDR
jgi:hypothetical protein